MSPPFGVFFLDSFRRQVVARSRATSKGGRLLRKKSPPPFQLPRFLEISRDFVALGFLSGEERRNLVVADDSFRLRIPFDNSIETSRDAAQVADVHSLNVRNDVGNTRTAFANAADVLKKSRRDNCFMWLSPKNGIV